MQIAALIAAGEVVYVQCRPSAHRTPMVSCAVLMHLHWTLKDARRPVSSKRAVSSLSDDQISVLQQLESALAERPHSPWL